MKLLEIEQHLLKMEELSDNLFIISRGLEDISPESQGAIRIISDVLRKEVEECIDLIFHDSN